MTEKKALNEIKDLAKKGKANAAKILTADLVRTRKQIENYYMMQSQLKSITLQLSSINTNVAIKNALGTAASTMAHVNQSLNMEDIKNVLKQYTKETAKMEMKGEMISDAMDTGAEVNDKDVDDVYNQVCQELSVEMAVKMGNVPVGKAQKNQQNAIVK